MILKEEHKYEIYRDDVKLCTQTMEEKDVFIAIANTGNYKIFYDGKTLQINIRKRKKNRGFNND